MIYTDNRWEDLMLRVEHASLILGEESHEVGASREGQNAGHYRRLRAKKSGVDLVLSYMREYAPDEREECIEAAMALHHELRIYEDCGHRHDEADIEAGRATDVHEVGVVCEEGFLYSICNECCAAGDRYTGQTECCVADHEHPCWPCPTVKALTGQLSPTEKR